MYREVKRGLKLAGEYLRLPPADGRCLPSGYPSKTVGADVLRHKRTSKEEREIYDQAYRPKSYNSPTTCPQCGVNMSREAHKPACTWQDNTNLFKTVRPAKPRDDSRRQAPKTSKPTLLVEKFLSILDTLKDDVNTHHLFLIFETKFKKEMENVDAAKYLKCTETKYKSMVKELYIAVYSHLQAEKLKKMA